MGNNSSKSLEGKKVGKAPAPRIHSNTYFGGNGQIGDIDEENIEETLRDLQLERLYQRAPHLRPKDPSETPRQRSLKTMISVSQPQPYIKKVGKVDCIVFGLNIQAPCRIVLIADSFLNSLSIEKCERTQISIPIPAHSDFMIEIQPDLERATTLIQEDFQVVVKHALIFKLVDFGDNYHYNFVEQHLFVEDNVYKTPIRRQCDMVTEDSNSSCLMCFKNPADVAIASCGHNVICSECLSVKDAHLHHCPICGELTT
ncbi:hypothetical protein TRFO_07974 [Tritrichomonas foetus]|uniref:RING-type domain-containing protein n=1 Tax=Tritrichomonas foetus TaxID=1144522 RepID=A0A1J4JMH3_9EUKA|nr:hypothetical protein TRFO_07974 [Tritrichomonas foetus]|eukprot:OHT00311.1 hypothetical protein TRFO_07974 [Tritrichomonas foetus]